MKTAQRAVFLVAIGLWLSATSFASMVEYTTVLSGTLESPPNTSPATGFADVILNLTAQTIEVKVTFSGLEGTTTASHIHCCTTSAGTGNAGVATTLPYFAGFPIGVTSGTYDHTLDLTLASSYNPSFVTANGGTTAGAAAALEAGLAADEAYLNIHTTTFPGGEIRGYLVATPEPGTFLAAGVALLGLMLKRRN